MPTNAVYLLVVPGFADWEPAHALAELRRHGGYRVEVVGLTRDPVTSMGGLTILPTRVLGEIDLNDVAVFILPGGDRWEHAPPEAALVALLEALEQRHIPIAAICAATVALARAGLIRDRLHTSNGRAYLEQHAPGYGGGARYVDAPAVRDRGLITASGLADVEFAASLFDELGVLSEPERRRWTGLFRGGRIP
ncbi:MAG: type 1 glutamine amidotransferase family protein [Gemmatimonadales bacterium]